MTLEELKKLYGEKGATEKRYTDTEQGRTEDYIPIQYGDGWSAFENDNRKIIDYIGQGMDATPVYDDAPKTLGGFSKQEGDYVTSYDPEGKYLGRQKWNESNLKTMIQDLGPLAMAALTMGGGAGMLGNSLFGLTGTAAAGAGGALAGGINAYGNDQNILKGALTGALAGGGAQEIGNTGFKLGDVNKAINFAKDPTLAGAANLFAPSVGGTQIGDTGISLNDVFKNVGTVQALKSGDNQQIFNAITGLVKDQGGNLKSSLAGFDANPDDFIQGYFQPGGEGYIDPNNQEMTVREEPENLDAFLRELSPYAVDGGRSVFAQDEDIPEFETVSNRPIPSIESILGTPDILETVEADVPELTIKDKREEEYIPGIRTKEIKSDIPDEITPDQIATLFPDLNINDILKLVTPDGTKTVTPTKTTTPDKKTTQETLKDLGLNYVQAPSQDPFADIKLMEELFGGDIGYKLRSLGSNTKQKNASSNMDALTKLLRG